MIHIQTDICTEFKEYESKALQYMVFHWGNFRPNMALKTPTFGYIGRSVGFAGIDESNTFFSKITFHKT